MPSTSHRTSQVPYYDQTDRVPYVSSQGPPSVPLQPYNDFHGDLYGDEEDLHGGEDDEQETSASGEEESEVERALFTKSDRLQGSKFQPMEKTGCSRFSSPTARSVPVTPVNQSEVTTWHRPAGSAPRTAGTPRLSIGTRGGDKEEEFESTYLDTCKAERGRVKPPTSPLKSAPARDYTVPVKTHKSTGHAAVRANLRLQVVVGDESDEPSPAAASSPGVFPRSRDGRHSLLTPHHSSSSPTTPISTPRSGRRRAVDLSHADKSLACEILFGGEEAELRSPVATARGLRKKVTERQRGREHRAQAKSPLTAGCGSKGSRSLGHCDGEEEGSSRERNPRHGRSRSGNCEFVSWGKSVTCDVAKRSVVLGEVQGLSLVAGEGFEEDTDCRIDNFDPVGNYLPYLGVGDAVYDKISGCKSSMK